MAGKVKELLGKLLGFLKKKKESPEAQKLKAEAKEACSKAPVAVAVALAAVAGLAEALVDVAEPPFHKYVAAALPALVALASWKLKPSASKKEAEAPAAGGEAGPQA